MELSRREWIGGAGSMLLTRPVWAQAPATKVAIGRCATYGAELLPVLNRMFDQLGGLGRLVKNKTVAIKVNLTGSPTYRLGYEPLEISHYTHPAVIGATVHLMGQAGAKRVRILESPWSTAEPLEEQMLMANWEPNAILRAAPVVECENTNWLGRAKKYSRFTVPKGGHVFPGFDLNHSYEDCDVFVSLAKMKDHVTAGITLSLKNCFGIAPCTIYGTGSGADEPSLLPVGGRSMFHDGKRTPPKSAPQEKNHGGPPRDGWRVPRIVADLVAARPIHLAIIEGIHTMSGGEGPWTGPGLKIVSPGVIIAGLDPVATDAVAMKVMNYDPMADRGKPPFETCDNTLRLAEELGAGTRNASRIEVVGVPVQTAKAIDFAVLREEKKALMMKMGGRRRRQG